MLMKDWSTLEKGDKLYLMVPVNTCNNDSYRVIKYVYQESEVINVHEYENHVDIRFKYTNDAGKRKRIGLTVNKTKYNDDYVTTDRRTGWAAKYEPIYGDMIVTFKDKKLLDDAYKYVVESEIDYCDDKIKEYESIKRYLKDIQYKSIL